MHEDDAFIPYLPPILRMCLQKLFVVLKELGVFWTDKYMCSWFEARYGRKSAEDQDWAS